MKAIWKSTVVAESSETRVVEGNHYFPPESLNRQYFKDSSTISFCPWKGEASYYNLEIEGSVNADAAWRYPSTKDAAKEIAGYTAFWRGVEVSE